MKRNNFSKMVLTLFASLALVITGTSTVNNKTQQVVKAEETGTVKYTIDSASSVTSTGAIEGSTATFKNTYTANKEQLTKSNSATLSITGLDGYIIKGIVLYMHSNSSKGAGTFSAKAGNETLAEISSGTAFNKWFDNTSFGTSYRNVTVTMGNSNYTIGTGEALTIVIAATVNSLFIQSYTLSYEKQSTPENIGQTFERASTKSQLKLAYSTNISYTNTDGVATIQYSGKTSNMTGENDALLLGVDENLFNVKSNKGTNDLHVGVNVDGTIRIYKGNIFEISTTSDKLLIKSIELSLVKSYNDLSKCTITSDEDATLTGTTYSFENGTTSFKIANDNTTQLRIETAKITYSGMAATYTYDIESTSLRFGTTISKDLYDGLVAEGTNVTFGVISQATSVLGENELTVENAGNTKALTPVRVDTELASEESETGNYYQFAVLFTGLTAADYTTEVTARCYVCIDGTYYYMQAKTCSVKSIAADYLSLQSDNEQVVANSGVLNYLANYTAE